MSTTAHLRVESVRVGGVQVLVLVGLRPVPVQRLGRHRRRSRGRGRRRGRRCLRRGGRLPDGAVVVVTRGRAVRAHVGLGPVSAALASVDEPRAVHRDVLELSRGEDRARGAACGRGLVLPMLVDARAAAAGVVSQVSQSASHYALLATHYSLLAPRYSLLTPRYSLLTTHCLPAHLPA